MSIKSVFGLNLKFYRKQKKLSQEQLSERLAITPKHLSSIETGSAFVSADLLEKLTQILEVSAADLFYCGEKTAKDASLFNLVSHIVEKELTKTVESIKIELKQIQNF